MASGEIELVGEQVRLRPILAAEIDELWQAMVAETSMAVAELPDEASFRRRLTNSGRLHGGTLDLAIDVGGELVGRIQTFEPPHRVVEAGIFHIGIGLQPAARGKGYGLDAVALLVLKSLVSRIRRTTPCKRCSESSVGS
jgi:RimJ/RimL family protein N-acetyltransferase